MAQVKFYRGPSSQYVTGAAASGTGKDVTYNSSYENVLYFATDQKVVYMNGIKYGYDMSGTGELQSAFLSVSYTAPTSSNPATVTFTQLNGQTQSITLFRVTSKSTAINVGYDSSTGAYQVGLDISNDDKLLTQESDGLKVNINLAYDKATKHINLTGKTKNGTLQNLASIDATDFVRDGMIKDVYPVVVDGTGAKDETLAEIQVNVPDAQTGEHYLKFVWNADSGQGSDSGNDSTWYDNETVVNPLVTYIKLEEFFNLYSTDSLGAVTINGYTIHFNVKSSNYLSDGANGLEFNDNAIDSSFAEIHDTTINGYRIGAGNMDILGTDISVGTIPAANDVSGDIVATDNIAVAIAKINKAMTQSSSDLGNEVDRIETAVGLANNGTLSGAFDTNHNLDVSTGGEVTHPTTVVDAILKLDNALYATNQNIESMDHDSDDNTNGDYIIQVSQLNGQVSTDKAWIVDNTLHGYTVPSGGSLSSADTIKGAFNKVDDALTWHDVTAPVEPEP